MSDAGTLASEQQNSDWPPAGWKDPFVPPDNYVLKLPNQLRACCTTLDDSADYDSAVQHIMESEKVGMDEALKIVAEAAERVPVLLFAAQKSKVGDLKKRNPADWMLTQLPNNPGSARAMYFHISVIEAIRRVRELFGTGGIVFHPVPCADVKDLWTITELYVMPGATLTQDELSDAKESCLYCNLKTTARCQFCQEVPVCSSLCAAMCHNVGLHSQDTCLSLTRAAIADDIVGQRKKLNAAYEELKREKHVNDETPPAPGTD
jgi:hypothetical protein